jgi:tetratricopeptide (TPR) repeat protein
MLLAMTVAGAMLLPLAGQGQEHQLSPGASKSPAPPLAKEVAKQVADDEAAIREALRHLDNPALTDAAIPKAEQVLQIRAAHQGDSWWESINARLAVADLRRISTLPAGDRASLAAAEQTADSVRDKDLEETGKSNQALDILLKAASTESQVLGPEHAWYAHGMYRVGRAYFLQLRYTEAETTYRQALEIHRKILGEEHPDYAADLEALAELYVAMARNQQAETLYQQALAIQKQTLGERDPIYATTLCNLGDLYRYMGRYAQAEPLYVQSLAIRKQALGEEHPDYARSLDRLAALYDSMGHYPQAEPLYKQAIAIRKQALGTQHADYARSLNNLALLYKEMGRYRESEPLYLEALTIRKKVFGEQHRTYASSLDDLAQLYQAMGKYEQAEPLYRQALEIRKKTIGEQHVAYAVNLDNLASLYEDMGRYRESEELGRQALEIRKKAVGEQHPGYARNLTNLAELYQTMGRYDQAEALYGQALAIQKNLLGEHNSDYATGVDDLASLYVAMGRNEQAETLYRQALEIEKQTVGEQHPIYATTLCNLGDLYRLMGRYAQAEPLYVQSRAIRKQALGEEHPDYARSLDRLAALYDSTGRYTQAEPLYKQAIKIRKKALGNEHPDYARSVNNLALLYKEMKRYQESEPLYLEAVAIRKKTLGEQHRSYASSLDDLAQLYQAMGKYEQAEPLYRQALEIRKKTIGEQHPAYAVNLDNLALLYKKMGKYDQAEPLFRQALEIRKNTVGEFHPAYARNLKHLATVLAITNRTQEASQLLLESAQLQWLHLTENFPTMSDQQKRQFLSRSYFLQSEELSTLVFEGKGDAKDGLRGVLLSKRLLFEVARQESGALAAAVAAAPPAWQKQWREREQLRHRYATVVLQLMSESGAPQPGGHKVDAAYVRSLTEQIEQLDARLRQGNPAYAATARVQQVKLEDISRALRPGEALAEYVRYQRYDFAAAKAGSAHYGVFLLLGGSGQVTAVELGEAKGIDEAVERFRAAVRGAIDQFKEIAPSRVQMRRSEEQVGLDSSAVRELVWQRLEPQLSGIKRVYVAPDGPLSLIPFEALARKDASGAWRYLAEDRELIYLGTGRDLSGLALSAGITAERPKTAVLIGNPAFSAKPEELAAQEAGANPPAAAAVIQPSVPSAPSTLGGVTGGNDGPRLQIPRNWGQVEVLAVLIQQAGMQLKRLGWSVTTLTDRWAVKEAVEAVAAPRILQFATHGYVLDRASDDPQGWDNPLLRSMLIMAGVNHWHPVYRVGKEFMSESAARARGLNEEQLEGALTELGDGVLTAYEVTGMKLQGTELVNLTACETGLGEVTPDGVAGLSQGFLLAGARSLTMSMWEVPADETTQQIGDFYHRWLGNEGHGQNTVHRYEAFHAAQVNALARARQDHGSGHPFYWAGMIFVGDPGDLPRQAGSTVAAKK